MSEYQYVAFRAIDRPLDPKQLAFAEKQSSHSELSKWEMSVEYHYSSFRGDVDGLLRSGFDVYLAYTNYGDREIRLRLSGGLPFSKATLKPFFAPESISWKKDSKGKGGILTVFPYHESGSIEEVWEFDDYLESLAKIREQLIKGDLRVLYLLWLCAAYDDNEDPAGMIEPPVPHGLAQISSHHVQLLPFFGMDSLTCEAAADGVPEHKAADEEGDPIEPWSHLISETRARALLRRFLKDDPASVKAELLAEIRDTGSSADWPTSQLERSLQTLLDATDKLRVLADEQQAKKAAAKARREAAKAEKQRQARMQEMKASPRSWLTRAEKTAAAGGTDNYQDAADILADLREAIGGDKGKKLVHDRAKKIAKAYPTLNMLKSSLRKRGLLD